VYGYKPITKRKFGVLHDRATPNSYSMMAMLAFVTQLVGFPIIIGATTFGANLNLHISDCFQLLYARGLIGVLGYKL